MKLHINTELLIGIVAVVLGLIAGAILMIVGGYDAVEGYRFLFAGGLMNLERIGNTLAMATPLILTGLSVAFAFRTGLFNIGTPGQVLVGGLLATIVGLTVNIPKPLLLSLMTLTAIAGGAVWGIIPGLLKARFNVHEVVSGIMMNWTIVEFGKRSGQVHERQAQVAEAEENLRHVENRVRVEIEKEVRKVRRAETGLEAARESVAARAEMRRITANQVEASTANPSALKEAEGQLAEAEAGLFQAEMERSTARAELERTEGLK